VSGEYIMRQVEVKRRGEEMTAGGIIIEHKNITPN
jgi:hypothetical protein